MVVTFTYPRRPARERHIALATCAELPDSDPDTQRVISPLAELGVSARAVVWNDPTVDWSAFDLVLIRSCWDYSGHHAEFLRWASEVPRLANTAAVLAWNTDKCYLGQLDALGVEVVPTTWVHPHDAWHPPAPEEGTTRWVIKPAVSLAALDTGRYDLSDPTHRRLAVEHVRRLQRAGRTVMVQPYMERVDSDGETSLVVFGGQFSHAMRKAAVLDGPDQGIDRRFMPNGGLTLRRCVPSAAQLDLARLRSTENARRDDRCRRTAVRNRRGAGRGTRYRDDCDCSGFALGMTRCARNVASAAHSLQVQHYRFRARERCAELVGPASSHGQRVAICGLARTHTEPLDGVRS